MAHAATSSPSPTLASVQADMDARFTALTTALAAGITAIRADIANVVAQGTANVTTLTAGVTAARGDISQLTSDVVDARTASDVAFAGLLAAVQAGGTGTTPGGTPPPTTDFFPADPSLAPAPSPENSQILVFNGAITGRPYLKDSQSAIHQLKLDASGVPQYYKNGFLFAVYPGEAVGQCLVRQGGVYMQLTDGIWKQVAPNGTMYNAALPPPWTSTTPGGVPVPALPGLPTPSAVAPGSSGKVIKCGVGQALATLSAAIPTASAGDTVQLVTGTYTDTPPAWTVPLLIDGGGSTFDAAGKTATLARGKALLCPAADSTIQNFAMIKNVAMDQTEGQLTSAIRPDDGCGYLTIKNVKASGNQCAIGQGGFAHVLVVDTCDISNNGLTSNSGSLTHDLYVGNGCVKMTLTNVTANGAVEGHAIKFRGAQLVVNGGTFASAPGKPFDLPNGTTTAFTITNANLVKAASDPDHGVLAYGEEGASNGLAGGTITGGSISAQCPNPSITGPGGTITASGVTLTGNPVTSAGSGVTLVGF